jgi:hypothetical protein
VVEHTDIDTASRPFSVTMRTSRCALELASHIIYSGVVVVSNIVAFTIRRRCWVRGDDRSGWTDVPGRARVKILGEREGWERAWSTLAVGRVRWIFRDVLTRFAIGPCYTFGLVRNEREGVRRAVEACAIITSTATNRENIGTHWASRQVLAGVVVIKLVLVGTSGEDVDGTIEKV